MNTFHFLQLYTFHNSINLTLLFHIWLMPTYDAHPMPIKLVGCCPSPGKSIHVGVQEMHRDLRVFNTVRGADGNLSEMWI